MFRMAQSGGGGKRRKKETKPPPPRGMEDMTEMEWQEVVNEVETSGASMTDVALLRNINYLALTKYVARPMHLVMLSSQNCAFMSPARMLHGFSLHAFIPYMHILAILCCRIMKRHKTGTPLRPADGRPPLVSPTFISEMTKEVHDRALAQNAYESKGPGLQDMLTEKRPERSDAKGHNPHFRVAPLTPSTLRRVRKQIAPVLAAGRIATTARQAAVLSVLNPITRGAVAGNMVDVRPELNVNIDGVLFELGDKMGDKPKVLLSQESRKILGSLGLQPTVTRDKQKYRVIQVVMTNSAAGEQIQAVIVFRDNLFEGCVSHRITDSLSVVFMNPKFDRPKFFAHYLGKRVLPRLFSKRRALEFEHARVRHAEDVGAMDDDELVAQDDDACLDNLDPDNGAEDDEEYEEENGKEDDEEEDEDFCPYQLADSDNEESDDHVSDTDEDEEEEDEVGSPEHITISFDGEHAQIKAAAMESVLRLCDDCNVSLVKSSGGNSLKEAPADRGLAHSKMKEYMRRAKYEDDRDNASQNMRTFVDGVLTPKSCKIKFDSKRVLRQFLYNIENALSHAWSRPTIISSWRLVGLWPLSFKQLLSQCLAWRDVDPQDATIILRCIGCCWDLHPHGRLCLF
jgi:hypothetical protein